MQNRGRRRSLLDSYRFDGFAPERRIKGRFGDPRAYVIGLKRRRKKPFVRSVERFTTVFTIKEDDTFGIFRGRTGDNFTVATCGAGTITARRGWTNHPAATAGNTEPTDSSATVDHVNHHIYVAMVVPFGGGGDSANYRLVVYRIPY